MLYNRKYEYRCKRCNKLLAKIVVKINATNASSRNDVLSNEIEIKCPRCEYMNLITMFDILDFKK
jgi:phage FluMu protein Com